MQKNVHILKNLNGIFKEEIVKEIEEIQAINSKKKLKNKMLFHVMKIF